MVSESGEYRNLAQILQSTREDQAELSLQLTPASQADLERVEQQLQRRPRGVVAIAARCLCQAPLVVATAPRLPDGTPFPTTFYLTHPAVVKAASVLEAEKFMQRLNQFLEEDSKLADHYARAHRLYLRQRDFVAGLVDLEPVPQVAHVSAGGMPGRVKCLHALVGHSLACGTGVNPVGDIALAEISDRAMWQPHSCYCQDLSEP